MIAGEEILLKGANKIISKFEMQQNNPAILITRED